MSDDEDDLPDALPGHAAEAGGLDVADVVLGLSGEVAKLAIVLSELDEASFSKVRPRLGVFLDLVSQLPRKAGRTSTRIRLIGFAPSRRRQSRASRP